MNKKYEEILNGINKLAEGQQDTEVLKSLGTLTKQVEEADKELAELVEAQNKLRKEYIEVVKSTSYKGENEPNKATEEVTLEELMLEQARKEKLAKKK